jgi:Cu/Ag efflux protein CusF
MKYILQSIALLATTLFLPLVVSAAEPSGEPGVILEDASVAVSTVTAIDEKTRQITLKDPDGDKSTFTAGPEVRNFAQIKRGDQVIMSYYEGFALELGPKGSGTEAKVKSVEVTRAKLGEKPSMSITNSTVAIGIVKAINRENRTVTLQGAERTINLAVSDDVDLSNVKVGDTAEAVYIASYAVQVVAAPKVSGTVELESTAIAIGIGITWGHGTLTLHDGTTHKIKISGLSVLDLGISKLKTTGDVYNLVELKDLDGSFIAGEVGIAVGKGPSSTTLKNANGVVIKLKAEQKGVRLTIAPAGMSIKLVE